MPIKHIVIAGVGLAGWMTACALVRRLHSKGYTITVIERDGIDDSLGIPSCAEATVPSTVDYHAALGLDENGLLSAAHGSFSLGRALVGWTRSTTPRFHPFGDLGASLGAVGFHHLVAKLRDSGEVINLNNYVINALCAQANRFTRPPEEQRSVLSSLEYGIHIKSDHYTEMLKRDAMARGVGHVYGRIKTAGMNVEGQITTVSTDTADTIKGDFFIDCSGPAGDIIRHILDVRFEDWSQWLRCNRSSTNINETQHKPLPFTHIEAQASGWQRFVPLQGAECETRVYYSEDVVDPAS